MKENRLVSAPTVVDDLFFEEGLKEFLRHPCSNGAEASLLSFNANSRVWVITLVHIYKSSAESFCSLFAFKFADEVQEYRWNRSCASGCTRDISEKRERERERTGEKDRERKRNILKEDECGVVRSGWPKERGKELKSGKASKREKERNRSWRNGRG